MIVLDQNEDVDMVIDESTPLLSHQEMEESKLSTLHMQISSILLNWVIKMRKYLNYEKYRCW